MTVNLRLSLTVFKVGFAAESASGFVALATGAAQLPLHGYLLALTPAFSAIGLLFLWVGRHEWNELHRTRVGHANLAFALSILATALAAAPVAYLAAVGSTSDPGWLRVEFGAAVAVVFAVTFITYALVAAHLVGRLGEIAMAVGLAWAAIISGLIGLALSPQLHPIVRAIASRTPSVGGVVQPIGLLDSLLGFSYLTFLGAFADAHRRVARGIGPEASEPGNSVPRSAP
ncbi:MAG TPA: hypothetical protein VGV89_04115 [Thermoplasmata archaeon]|nr:hypothetical protein [Thermoplasmata archaeon]